MTPFVRNLLLAVGALALLTGVAIGIVWLRSGSGSPAASVQAEKTGPAILVAAKAIEPGALLRPEDMTWRDIGEAKAPAGALVRGTTSEAEIAGSVARRGFAPGEIIAAQAILRPNERGFLAAVLRPGYRAATIPIDAPQSASGLILPGDRVDVILVQQLESKDSGRKSVGETVLRDSRVVAVGHALQPATQQQQGQAAPADTAPRTLTLEALPNDAERLFVASQLGKLEVALRPVAEPNGAVTPNAPVYAGDVSAALSGGARPSSIAATAAPTTRASQGRRTEGLPPVQILRGSKSSQ